MGKMKELSQTLDDMIRAGEDLIQAANELKAYFSDTAEATSAAAAPVKTESAAPVNKTAAKKAAPETKQIELTDVRKLLAEKSRDGFTSDVKALLKKYGAAKLSQLDPDHYEAVMTEAEVLGNG